MVNEFISKVNDWMTLNQTNVGNCFNKMITVLF